jgi:SSS family solute:Na+ symporter
MTLTFAHIAGAVLTLAGILWLGISSGKKVKSAEDFDTGGKSAGPLMVFGGITGTLVGGSATIGTAQLAFTSGLSAWWFALGSALGCLILMLALVRPVRKSGCTTIQQMIHGEYGSFANVVTSVLTTVGTLLNIVSQVLAANALLTTMFGLSPLACAVVSVVVMACYITLGGMRGASILGVVKLALIYLSVVVSGLLALRLAGGWTVIWNTLPHDQYFNLFARGMGIDLGAGLSVALGVLSSQVYIQAVVSGKSDAAAIKGTLLCTLLIPPVGALCILVGYYMRLHFPHINAAQALPLFVVTHLPPFFAGVVLATLLIAVVGTGAGMALGFGTIMTNDIYRRYIDKNASGKKLLTVSRIVILLSLIMGAVLTAGNLGSAVLTWGFLSMGLRATVLVMPMLSALFLPGRVDGRWATASSIVGFGAMALAALGIINIPVDPVFVGIGAGGACILAGYLTVRIRRMRAQSPR